MGSGPAPRAPGCEGRGLWAGPGWQDAARGPAEVQAGRAAYLQLGERGSGLRMGNSGSLSTPCSCFSLYSFCRSTSWCRSRSLEHRRLVRLALGRAHCLPPGPFSCPSFGSRLSAASGHGTGWGPV